MSKLARVCSYVHSHSLHCFRPLLRAVRLAFLSFKRVFRAARLHVCIINLMHTVETRLSVAYQNPRESSGFLVLLSIQFFFLFLADALFRFRKLDPVTELQLLSHCHRLLCGGVCFNQAYKTKRTQDVPKDVPPHTNPLSALPLNMASFFAPNFFFFKSCHSSSFQLSNNVKMCSNGEVCCRPFATCHRNKQKPFLYCN